MDCTPQVTLSQDNIADFCFGFRSALEPMLVIKVDGGIKDQLAYAESAQTRATIPLNMYHRGSISHGFIEDGEVSLKALGKWSGRSVMRRLNHVGAKTDTIKTMLAYTFNIREDDSIEVKESSVLRVVPFVIRYGFHNGQIKG